MTDDARLGRLIETGQLEAMERLLSRRPDLVSSTRVTPPPLHWAVFNDRLEAAAMLLDYGADLEMLDSDRQASPLDWAVVYCRRAIAALLIERGADVSGRLTLARRGADGAFEAYPDTPARSAYADLIALLESAADASAS